MPARRSWPPNPRFSERLQEAPLPGVGVWLLRVEGGFGSKQPYFIHYPAAHMLMFAGLWEAWRASKGEEWGQTFTIVTGEPGKVSGDIHDRSP